MAGWNGPLRNVWAGGFGAGVTLDMLRRIDRNREPPDEGLMCELLWSDPGPQPGRNPSKRGVGVAFGADVTQEFLRLNNLELVAGPPTSSPNDSLPSVLTRVPPATRWGNDTDVDVGLCFQFRSPPPHTT